MSTSFDNAERISKELLHERASIWYVSDNTGFKIMIKAPSTSIRAIIKGCRVEFLFGKDELPGKPVFHAGVRIYDDPIHFICLSGAQRFVEDHNALVRIIKNELIAIQFYNELSTCVATSVISFDAVSRKKVLNIVGKASELYTGVFDQKIAKSLDCFDYSFDKTRQFENVHEIETLSIQGQFSNWRMMDNHFVGLNDQSMIIINDTDEGEVFEKQVWAPLESIFDYNIYRQPNVKHKSNLRELTDILAFSPFGIFLVETKALAILSNDKERNMDRKVAGLQKQIWKGFNQLVGAAKKVAENATIFNSKGEIIVFDRKLLPHCIVLVSELLPFGDWTPTVMKMIQCMIDQPMQLHVMDLMEFMRYIGYSKGRYDMFDYMLMKRTEDLVKHQNIHLALHVQYDDNKSTDGE